MHRRRTGWIAAAIACCLVTAASAADVTGRIVDRRGKAVADVAVATMWSWADGAPRAHDTITVNDDGTFSGDVRFRNGEAALAAYSADGKRAGLAIVKESETGAITITVDRAVRVRGRLKSADLTGDFAINSLWSVNRHRVMTVPVRDRAIDFTLPMIPESMTWDAYMYGSDVRSKSSKHTLESNQRTLNLGTIDFDATYITLQAGLPAEAWTVSESRGLPIDAAQISDLKGRWVLVEFWGHW